MFLRFADPSVQRPCQGENTKRIKGVEQRFEGTLSPLPDDQRRAFDAFPLRGGVAAERQHDGAGYFRGLQ
jgi:hypothetical protein